MSILILIMIMIIIIIIEGTDLGGARGGALPLPLQPGLPFIDGWMDGVSQLSIV